MIAVLAGLAFVLPSPAVASDAWQFELSAATGAVTRGLVDSNKAPTVGVGANWYPDPSGGFFIGASALSIRNSAFSQTGAKIVADAGYTWRLDADWTLQAIVSRYQFARVPFAGRMAYHELELRGGWRDFLFASLTASPDTAIGWSSKTRAFSYDVAGRLPLEHGFSATAGIGYYDLRAQVGGGYVYADAGLTYQYRTVQFDLWYIGTQAPAATRARMGPLLSHGWTADVVWHF
ncbi:hypothetical protein WKR88_15270 [Trinickia caryophylli]|uniref:Outer membrane protein n=1 Tax=Trinickia caryophylli TaxID=28094 RepID=A0A1X7D5S8_TRICW|nr:hypothetical protein [Trinickia caryophylli]PMS12702.1 hypothetical protein C0Z17_07670 [Trinickia caryophylli]TRX15108.1 hypothetical protein FNF07_28345 [Trinickia caryophylli]WQE14968.1 hypothetical protein U0034_20665 [Trinickia caryophylli]SMF09388.1 conserved hypothetical protein [Trinickia caryophylli]GLU31302.1 hypothetical protein Busp01_11440 [Trinickia caryophylli]